MKIEKINDNQIKCTLTKDDLADRELKLSELAYGTDKAKSLFKDMMQQASYEFGFEADDIPLMIEAIPLSPDCIILIITKVDDPEELDTRFAKFAPSVSEEDIDTLSSSVSKIEGADDILGLFKRIYDAKSNNTGSDAQPETTTTTLDVPSNLTRLYLFTNLDAVIGAAHALNNFFTGYNSLYKNQTDKNYSLVVSKSKHTPEEFNKVCNILSEYGKNKTYSIATEAYLGEHLEAIIREDALQRLATI